MNMDTLDSLRDIHARKIVVLIYRTMLGRDPDADGLESYFKRLREGESLEKILSEVYVSDEYIKRNASTFPPVETAPIDEVSDLEARPMESFETESRAKQIYLELKSELAKKQGDY